MRHFEIFFKYCEKIWRLKLPLLCWGKMSNVKWKFHWSSRFSEIEKKKKCICKITKQNCVLPMFFQLRKNVDQYNLLYSNSLHIKYFYYMTNSHKIRPNIIKIGKVNDHEGNRCAPQIMRPLKNQYIKCSMKYVFWKYLRNYAFTIHSV